MSLKSFKEFLNESESKGTYVAVKVQNGEQLYKHFLEQGLTILNPEGLHTTIAYSKVEFKHKINPEDIVVEAKNIVSFDQFGDDEQILVLVLKSPELKSRFDMCIKNGAVYDYNVYVPHITLSYDYRGNPKEAFKLPNFDILLGNEYSEELNVEHVAEAYDNLIGKHDRFVSRENDWNDYKSSAILIQDNLSSNHYKLYKIPMMYILTNENDEYLRSVEYLLDNTVLTIVNTHSEISGGFYNLMFSTILAKTKVTEILSDEGLSKGAIRSYNKLSNFNHFKIRVKTEHNYVDYSESNLMSDDGNRISIMDSSGDLLKERFNRFYNKMNTEPFIKMYNNYSKRLDYYIFCEAIY